MSHWPKSTNFPTSFVFGCGRVFYVFKESEFESLSLPLDNMKTTYLEVNSPSKLLGHIQTMSFI